MMIEKSKCRDIINSSGYDYSYKINLVCALFGTAISTTSSFNFVVIKVNILKVDKSTLMQLSD